MCSSASRCGSLAAAAPRAAASGSTFAEASPHRASVGLLELPWCRGMLREGGFLRKSERKRLNHRREHCWRRPPRRPSDSRPIGPETRSARNLSFWPNRPCYLWPADTSDRSLPLQRLQDGAGFGLLPGELAAPELSNVFMGPALVCDLQTLAAPPPAVADPHTCCRLTACRHSGRALGSARPALCRACVCLHCAELLSSALMLMLPCPCWHAF